MAEQQQAVRPTESPTKSPTNSYDDVPYPSFPFPESHPDRLAMVARLFGMTPKDVAKCRVLELGCASGGNLIPMADHLPKSKFVGIDASGREIGEGQERIDALGLKNIELRHEDLQDIGKKLGKFDYIICHGVYSWVPTDVQDKLLAVCNEHLTDDGVAYVSYNTLPGWRMRGMIRDMMLYHASKFESVPDRVAQARALLKFLSESVPTENNAFGILLKSELEVLRKCSDSYLFHDHLEPNNRPVYFHQFVEHATRAGLQYVGDAELELMWAGNFSADVEKMLQQVANDVIASEQYQDFLRNRMFRKTLLARQGREVNRLLQPERLQGMYIAANLQPLVDEVDVRSTERVSFQLAGRRNLTTGDPIMKAAVLVLRESWPQPMAFEELFTAARARLGSEGVQDAARVDADRQVLSNDLLKCLVAGMVELRTRPADYVSEVSSKPAASRLARHQAEGGNIVTSLRHQIVRLADIDRHVVRHLDGKRDHDGLVEVLVKLCQDGTLVVQKDGQRVEDGDQARGIVADAVAESLPRLAAHALLRA